MSKNFAPIVVVRLRVRGRATATFRMRCAWSRTCWTNTFSTCAPFGCGAANSARRPPFDIGPDTLFVAYSAWAEMTCFMVLGWQFPGHIFDLHTAYLAASNMLLPHNPDEEAQASRANACPTLAAPTASTAGRTSTRRTIAKDIGEGRWREYGTRGRVRLLRRGRAQVGAAAARAVARLRRAAVMLPAADVERVLHWSNYSAKTIAQIQARGCRSTCALWNLVQENKAAVIGELLRQVRSEPRQRGSDLHPRRRMELCALRALARPAPASRAGRDWKAAQLDIDGDAFRLMYHVPGHRGPARAARQPRRHRAGEAADRARRAQSAEPVSLRHRDRAQRARARACTTPTPACAPSWSSRPTRSASISIGGRRRSASRPRYPATPR